MTNVMPKIYKVILTQKIFNFLKLCQDIPGISELNISMPNTEIEIWKYDSEIATLESVISFYCLQNHNWFIEFYSLKVPYFTSGTSPYSIVFKISLESLWNKGIHTLWYQINVHVRLWFWKKFLSKCIIEFSKNKI